MRYHSLRRSIRGSLLGLALLGSNAWSLPAHYTLTVLGPEMHRGSPVVGPTAIDPDDGTVVQDQTMSVDYPTALQLAPVFRAIGPTFSGALDVEAGRIVGYIWNPATGASYHVRAAVWEQGEARILREVDLSEPFPSSMATCVNAAGDIWGTTLRRATSTPPRPDTPGTGAQAQPVEWVDGVTFVTLPTLGGDYGSVEGCNDGGDSAGWSTTASGAMHCTQWFADGTVHDCHPGHGTSTSYAVAMNNRGQLAANATQHGRSFGYLWQWPWLTWLMPLHGDTESQVIALNENGEAVGRSCNSNACRAIGWERRRPVDLLARTRDAEGWTLHSAVAISDAGLIVAQGAFDDGTSRSQERTVLLTPVETPTEAWFAWKARIYNWYVQQYVVHLRHAGR